MTESDHSFQKKPKVTIWGFKRENGSKTSKFVLKIGILTLATFLPIFNSLRENIIPIFFSPRQLQNTPKM
jgi:hypothetical protein